MEKCVRRVGILIFFASQCNSPVLCFYEENLCLKKSYLLHRFPGSSSTSFSFHILIT